MSSMGLFYAACILAGISAVNSFMGLPEFKVPELKLPDIKVPDVLPKPINNVIFSNKCLDDLGCFYTGPPFYNPITRPISLPPYDLKDMKTKFMLYTPNTKKKEYLLEANEESLKSSPFDSQLPVKFIIHGYMVDLKGNDVRFRMKDALLEEGNYNVIIVNWTNSNKGPYMQAVANCRVVGAQIAQLVKFIQKSVGVGPESVHIIGHSLGAHAAGFAGERLPKLSRISALDPAGPYFRYGEKEIRLDLTDAEFLDVIHTDTGNIAFEGLGIKEAIGHLDFFPNGGYHQPGCEPTLLNFTVAGVNITAVGSGEGITSLMATSCDHSRANDLYTATINNKKCAFEGVQCEDYDKYKEGKCYGNKKAVMGFHATFPKDNIAGLKYYLNTGKKFPYCPPKGNNYDNGDNNDTDSDPE